MDYKISICIPTYNRADRLEKLLAQLCPMVTAGNQAEMFQVCVSDNASVDHTAEVLRRYQEKYSFLKCKRNQKNLGFGCNFWSVAHMAEGEYIYFTGDDDAFRPNAVEVLLSACTEQDAGLILFASHTTDRSKARGFTKGELVPIESLGNYTETLGIFYASFIGNLCFKRSAFFRNCDIGESVRLSAYPHMFPALRTIKSGNALFINSPVTDPDFSPRGWHKMQPIYTAVDMARIAKKEVVPHLSKSSGRVLLLQLAKSLPRGVAKRLMKQINIDKKNPYQSLQLKNLMEIYC